MAVSLIREARLRLARLRSERSTWDTHWKELRDRVFPWAGNWVSDGEEQNDGRARNDPITSVGREALMALAAGMQSGLTPRSERWFGLQLNSPNPAFKRGQVSRDILAWLDVCTTLMLDILSAGNFYHACAQIYEDLGLFGTSVVYVEPDFYSVVRFKHLSVGEYWLSDDWQGRPDTLIRNFKVPAKNLVSEFGEENVSRHVAEMAKCSPDTLVSIIHAVMPRREGNENSDDPKKMPYSSVYFEESCSDDDKPLRESGYRKFPFLCARWSVHGEDVYGHSPAMYALADIKQAAVMTEDVADMVEKIVRPPLQGPSELDREAITLDPDSLTIVPGMSRNGCKIEPILNINPGAPQLVQQALQWIEDKIKRAFHYDIFMMFTGDESKSMTATEVLERKQIRLTQLGPVLERMQSELFGPMIDLIWDRCVETGILPPPPQDLEGGEDVKVIYRAALAKASDLSRVTNIQQFVQFIGAIAQIKPEIVSLIDADKVARLTAQYLDVPPEILKSEREVEAERQAQAQAQQQQQQMAMMQQGASTASSVANAYGQFGQGSQALSNVDTENGNNAYNQLMNALTGGGQAGM